MNANTLQYRAAAVQSATPVQLLCMLYDTLVRDFNRILAAIKAGNIEARSTEVKHALLVLEQLEAQLDKKNGGEAAANLARLYAVARAKVLEGHARVEAPLFQELIALFQDVRTAWEQVMEPRPPSDSEAPGKDRVASLSCSV